MTCCAKPYSVTRLVVSRDSETETVFCMTCGDGAPKCPTCNEVDWYNDCLNCSPDID